MHSTVSKKESTNAYSSRRSHLFTGSLSLCSNSDQDEATRDEIHAIKFVIRLIHHSVAAQYNPSNAYEWGIVTPVPITRDTQYAAHLLGDLHGFNFHLHISQQLLGVMRKAVTWRDKPVRLLYVSSRPALLYLASVAVLQDHPLSTELLQRIFNATIQHRVHFTNDRGEKCRRRIFLDFAEPVPDISAGVEEGNGTIEGVDVCFRFDYETILELLEARFIVHASCNCAHIWQSESDPYAGLWYACKRYAMTGHSESSFKYFHSCLAVHVVSVACNRGVTRPCMRRRKLRTRRR